MAGFQQRRAGSMAAVTIAIALMAATAAGQSGAPNVRRFDLRRKAAPQEGAVVLRQGEQWSDDLILAQGQLEIEARLNRGTPPGSSYALEVWVNGQPVTSPPINKQALMRDADGRHYPHREPGGNRWMLVSGPDALSNNGLAVGGSDVKTDPGQAYRYVWDVRPLLRGSAPAQVRVRNLADGPGQAIQFLVREGAGGVSPGDQAGGTDASPAVVRHDGIGVPVLAGRISNIVTAREVRQGQAIGITDQFLPKVNPIYVWFRASGFATGTTLVSRWLYLGGREAIVVGTAEAPVKPGSDHNAFSLELAPGRRWPAGDYRTEILTGGTVLGSAMFAVVAR